MSLINHTPPDDKIPSKNQDRCGWTPNICAVGEYTTNPKKNPPQVLKHIGQDNIPDIKLPISDSGKNQLYLDLRNMSLIGWNIDPNTIMFIKPYDNNNQPNNNVIVIIFRLYLTLYGREPVYFVQKN